MHLIHWILFDIRISCVAPYSVKYRATGGGTAPNSKDEITRYQVYCALFEKLSFSNIET